MRAAAQAVGCAGLQAPGSGFVIQPKSVNGCSPMFSAGILALLACIIFFLPQSTITPQALLDCLQQLMQFSDCKVFHTRGRLQIHMSKVGLEQTFGHFWV